MNSSTSNSEAARSQRRVFLRVFAAIVLGMGIALALVRVIAWANGATSSSILGRVLEARQALPRVLAEDKDLAMFFGSSMVQAGFSPRQFDTEMAQRGVELKAFNFGFGGLNPLFQARLSKRIVEDFERADRRLKLVMIEFNPFQTTVTRRQRAVSLEDSFIGLLGTPGEMLDILLEDPTRGVRLFTIRYLRDGLSAEMITNHYGESFQIPRPETDIPEDESLIDVRAELGKKLNERFEAEYPDFDDSQWYYPWQGGGTIPEERPATTVALVNEWYSTLHTDHRMDNDRLWRIFSADIVELNFDEDLVAAFIEMVHNFKQIADHVEVVMLPKNSDWIVNPPAALARQRAVVERIGRETGVVVRDWQSLDSVPPEYFSDTTHLARYTGAVAFTRHLAEHYAPILQD